MSGLSDRFATWDAAYVLGALSPVERLEYEEHLAGCPACQSAVSELAGMPGLLAQVPPEDAALLAAAPGVELLDDGPPPDLLARLRALPNRRRRLARTLIAALGCSSYKDCTNGPHYRHTRALPRAARGRVSL